MKSKLPIIILFILTLLLTACGINTKEYGENVQKVQSELIVIGAKSETMLNLYADLWSKGINKKPIIPDDLANTLDVSKIHLGSYFNVTDGTMPRVIGGHQTLVNNLQSFYAEEGQSDELNELLSEVKKDIKELNNPPKEYEEVFDKLLDMYSLTEEIASLAISPSGSLITFNDKRGQLSSDIVKMNNEIEVLLPN